MVCLLKITCVKNAIRQGEVIRHNYHYYFNFVACMPTMLPVEYHLPHTEFLHTLTSKTEHNYVSYATMKLPQTRTC